MTDSQKDKAEDTLESTSSLDGTTGATPTPDVEQVQSTEPSKPETSSIPTPFSENKPTKPPVVLAKPAEAPANPTTVKVGLVPKATKTESASSRLSDPSISVDADSSPNVGALILDAIAAATAIAFSVLLAQDVIPFL
tara:strand:- start:615 stop:1028 length:414 start_codon:yes stop_codon:yes gene_type:complete